MGDEEQGKVRSALKILKEYAAKLKVHPRELYAAVRDDSSLLQTTTEVEIIPSENVWGVDTFIDHYIDTVEAMFKDGRRKRRTLPSGCVPPNGRFYVCGPIGACTTLRGTKTAKTEMASMSNE